MTKANIVPNVKVKVFTSDHQTFASGVLPNVKVNVFNLTNRLFNQANVVTNIKVKLFMSDHQTFASDVVRDYKILSVFLRPTIRLLLLELYLTSHQKFLRLTSRHLP